MFLIDTDVLSALRRRERHPEVVEWLSVQRDSDLHLSVVTIGEVERGIVQQQGRDPWFAQQLAAWLDGILARYGDRVSLSAWPPPVVGADWPQKSGIRAPTC